jgi:uncharacterized protein (DUF111 family)
MEKLFEIGAQDVYFTPIIMKKSRPATKFSVLCLPEKLNECGNFLLRESTTLGYRSFPVTKKMLFRKSINVQTRFGQIEVKVAASETILEKFKPEYDQCKEAALKYNVPLKTVIDEVLQTLKTEKKNG